MPGSVKSNAFLFADDAEIYKSINSLNDHDIDNLAIWSSDWLLTVNLDKCNVLKAVRTP